MSGRLSREARRALEQRAAIDALVRRMTPDLVAKLDRLGRHSPRPDGFSRGGEGSGVSGGDVGRPVELAVLARQEPAVADPVGDMVRNVFGALSEAAGVLAQVDRWLRFLDAYGDGAIVRVSSLAGDCLACGRSVSGAVGDRLVSGYCGACRKAWERAGYPDRMAFERDRRGEVSA